MEKYFNIVFYDTEMTISGTENFSWNKLLIGTYDEAKELVENEDTYWMRKYKVGDTPDNGVAIINEITQEQLLIKKKIERLEKELEELYIQDC